MKSVTIKNIQEAAFTLSQSTEKERNAFLTKLSDEIQRVGKKIIAANQKDLRRARKAHLPEAFVQRLVVDEKGIAHLMRKLAEIRRLTSGLGETIEKRNLKNGLLLKKVRVPLGVLLIIYESRPEVTIDVAALSVKAGNAVILKGGSEALATNRALYACIVSALKKSGLPRNAVRFLATRNRSAVNALLKRHDAIDLVIARGGYSMVKAVIEETRIPVLAH